MELFGISISAYILSLISIVLFSYVLILIISLIRNKGIIDFASPIINEKGKISKSGLLFFLITLVVTYQALYQPEITPGLLEILAALAFKDAGIEIANKWQHVQLTKIKKTNDKLDLDDFKNL